MPTTALIRNCCVVTLDIPKGSSRSLGSWLDQVLLLGEEVIGTPRDFAPEALGGEVDEVGEGGGLRVASLHGISVYFQNSHHFFGSLGDRYSSHACVVNTLSCDGLLSKNP